MLSFICWEKVLQIVNLFDSVSATDVLLESRLFISLVGFTRMQSEDTDSLVYIGVPEISSGLF